MQKSGLAWPKDKSWRRPTISYCNFTFGKIQETTLMNDIILRNAVLLSRHKNKALLKAAIREL